MRGQKVSDEILDYVIACVEAGEMLAPVCRDVGISPQTVRARRRAQLPEGLRQRSEKQNGRNRAAQIRRGRGFRAPIIPSRKTGKY